MAVYLRDGLACAYCGQSVEDGVSLTLDHLVARSAGGAHRVDNLVTACRRCNSVRKDRPVTEFAGGLAEYLNGGLTGDVILAHIQDCLSRPLPLAEAKNLIARRGSAARVLAEMAR